MTKTQQREANARIRRLRDERRMLLTGNGIKNTGVPWCRGPRTWGHQEPTCDGCATRKLGEWKAGQVTAEIIRIQHTLP